MIVNPGAGGGSGGLKVVASGGASVYGSATVDLPRAAQFLAEAALDSCKRSE